MTNEEYQEVKQNILSALDKAIENGDWGASLFFQNIGKRLVALRDQVDKDLEQEEKQLAEEGKIIKVETKPGFCKVYISLHQADGENLDRWQHTIKMLSEYNISRPVYGEQEHVRELIRAKADAKREAQKEAQANQ